MEVQIDYKLEFILVQMFAVKVQYKGKIINLGKSITCLKKIETEVKNRFPFEFKYGMLITYQDQILEDFQQIEQIVKKNNSASIKIKVNELSQEGIVEVSKISSQRWSQQNQTTSINIGGFDSKPQEGQLDKRKEQTQVINLEFGREVKLEEIKEKLQEKIQVQAQEKIEPKVQVKLQEKVQVNKQQKLEQKQSDVNSQILADERQKKSIQKRSRSISKSSVKSNQIIDLKENTDEFKSIKSKNSSKNQKIQKGKLRSSSRASISGSKRRRKSSQRKKSDEKINKSIIKKEIIKKQPKRSSSEDSSIKMPIYQSKQRYPLGKYQQKKQQNKTYKCYKCFGLDSDSCNICEGFGQFSHDHAFVKFINKIVESRMEKILSEYGIQNLKKGIKPERKLNFEIIGERILKPIKIGQKLYWQFQIYNNGDDWIHQMEIMDEENSSTLVVGKLSAGDRKKMNVGPIIYQKAGNYEKLFRLCFFNKKGQLEHINKLFGFKVLVEEPERKRLTNYFRNRVEILARQQKSKHGIQFLIQKFRQMGFSEQNASSANDDFLRDAIGSFQNI